MGVASVPGIQGQRQGLRGGWLLSGTIAVVVCAAGWPDAARAQGDPNAPAPTVEASASASASAAPVEVPCVVEHEQSQLLRQEGKLLDARTLLLECARVECAPAIRGDCVRWRQELQQSIPSLVFAATLDGEDHSEVVVSMQGQVLARHLDGRALELDPGEYDFGFESASGQTLSRRIAVREGEKARLVSVAFVTPGAEAHAERPSPQSQPQPPPPAPTERPVPTIAYALSGLAVVATASWIYFGTSALEKERDASEQCAPFCSTNRTDDIRIRVWAADVSAAVAVTAAAAALYTYWTRPEVSVPQPAAGWRVGVGIAGGRDPGILLGAGRRF